MSSKKLTRTSLAIAVHSRLGIPMPRASLITNDILNFIIHALSNGIEIKITHLGHFKLSKRNPHTIQHPGTLQLTTTQPRIRLSFSPSIRLKQRSLINSHLFPLHPKTIRLLNKKKS